MEGQAGGLDRGHNELRRRAKKLLGEGLPIDLTRPDATKYLERAESVHHELSAYVTGPATDPAAQLMLVQVLASMTVAASHVDIDTATELANRAEMAAANCNEELAHAYALVAWGFANPGPEHAGARVSEAYRVLEMSERLRDAVLDPAAWLLLLVGLLEQGDIRTLDVQLLERRGITRGVPKPGGSGLHNWVHCLRSILDGDTEAAEQQVEAVYAATQRESSNALAHYTTQVGMIRWMQGRIDGAEEGFFAARRAYPEQLLWTASLAWLWLRQGRTDSGETLLRQLPEPHDLPRDRYWLSTMVVLAEVAIATGSRDRASAVRDLLLPYAEQFVPAGAGVAFWGTAARTLGLLEERLGLLSEARQHLELAVEMSARIGALAWHAEAQIELAEFAIRHDITEIAADVLLAEARATSEARGFPGLARRAMHRPRVSVLGTFEVTSLCGRRAEWTSRKARELLKMLIAARGTVHSREVYMDELWPDEHPSQLGNRFSVAVNVIRRALDPDRLLPTQHHIVTEGDSIKLDIDAVDVDLERFLLLAQRGDEQSRREALRLYRGDAFSEEPYADWAVVPRDYARHMRTTLAGEAKANIPEVR